jgi:hypothetical protein
VSEIERQYAFSRRKAKGKCATGAGARGGGGRRWQRRGQPPNAPVHLVRATQMPVPYAVCSMYVCRVPMRTRTRRSATQCAVRSAHIAHATCAVPAQPAARSPQCPRVLNTPKTPNGKRQTANGVWRVACSPVGADSPFFALLGSRRS